MSFGILEAAGFLLSLIPLAAFFFYQRKYRIYNGGLQGEKTVIKHLNKTLNDEYYLLNDVYMHNGGGDIDHIVLGPNGVFVLETKNWSGKITCNGDDWQRPGKHDMGSPSRQAKRNAAKIIASNRFHIGFAVVGHLGGRHSRLHKQQRQTKHKQPHSANPKTTPINKSHNRTQNSQSATLSSN